LNGSRVPFRSPLNWTSVTPANYVFNFFLFLTPVIFTTWGIITKIIITVVVVVVVVVVVIFIFIVIAIVIVTINHICRVPYAKLQGR